MDLWREACVISKYNGLAGLLFKMQLFIQRLIFLNMDILTLLRRIFVILLAVGVLYLVVKLFGRIVVAVILLIILTYIIYKFW